MPTDSPSNSQRPSSSARPSRHGHRKKSNPAARIALLTAPLVTLGAVGVGIAQAELGSETGTTASMSLSGKAVAAATVKATDRVPRLDRSVDRSVDAASTAGKEQPARTTLKRWSTDDLDIRATPAEKAEVVKEVDPATKLVATGRISGAFSEISFDGKYRWVTTEYLSAKKPKVKKPEDTSPDKLGLSDQACANSGVENGLTADAVRVYRAVCNNFPMVSSYGGYDAHGEHSSGKAIDIMISDVANGTRIAEFLRAHASELNLYDVIWRQHIWTPVRSAEGWRSMPNRGSATANHYDHVHVSVN